MIRARRAAGGLGTTGAAEVIRGLVMLGRTMVCRRTVVLRRTVMFRGAVMLRRAVVLTGLASRVWAAGG